MTITANDIEIEHRAALASLNAEQRAAIERLRAAKQRANFNGHFPEENLQAMFVAEAQARMDEAQTHAEAPRVDALAA